MNEKMLLEALSMDLLRVALGLRRGSVSMAKRFAEEASKRQAELAIRTSNPYIKGLIHKTAPLLNLKKNHVEEDILMYSVLFQNFARKQCPA